MKRIIMAVVLAAGMARGEMKLVEDSQVTNSWGEAVRLSDQGMMQFRNDDGYYVNLSAYGSDCITYTNTLWYGYAIQECQKDHVDDWPKVTTTVTGVQRRREWVQTDKVNGEAVEVRWERYDYPHTKITVERTERLVKQVEYGTNVVTEITDPKCQACGRR